MTWTVNLSNTGLNGIVTNAIADGSYTYAEVLSLLDAVALGGITESEWTDLKTVYSNSTALFASDYVKTITYNVVYGNFANANWWYGAKTMSGVAELGNLSGTTTQTNAERLIDKWFLGLDLPMPIAGGDAAKGIPATYVYDYQLANGTLFVNGVSASDVNQGAAGDCYYVATLGAVANASPSVISGAFIDNGNGSYGVKFYLNNVAAYTTVNLNLPTTPYGSIAFSGNVNKSLDGELWVALLEKAYAQLNMQADVNSSSTNWTGANSYRAIENGFAQPIQQLTGLSYKYYSSYFTWMPDDYSAGTFYSADPQTYKQTLIHALNGGAVGWLGTWGTTFDAGNGRKNFVGGYDDSGSFSGHAFMLLGYNAVTDKFIVRNPWGDGGPSNANSQFEASITEFWNASVMGVVAISEAATAAPIYTYSLATSANSSATAVTEGGAISFTVTRSASGIASTVYVSTTTGSADSADYQAVSKSAVNFASYETSKIITVNTNVDTLSEGTENLALNVFLQAIDASSVASATAYIKDPVVNTNYTYSVSSSAASAASAVAEGGTVNFTITRSASGTASTVYLSTTPGSADNSDYQGLSQWALNFASYETSKTVSVAINQDALTEGNESFALDVYKNIGDTTQAATAQATIKDSFLPFYNYTITSNAGSPSTAITEGGKVSFTITRNGSGTASTVYVSTSDGTAGASDYVGRVQNAITFAPNEKIAVIEIETNQDWWFEADEFFSLNLYKNLTDATYANTAGAFIKDGPVSSYNYTITSAADLGIAVTEGSPVTFTITRSGSGSASSVFISTTTGSADHSDYQPLDKSELVFAANETSKTVSVNTYTDALLEGDEYFWLDLYRHYADSSFSAYAYGLIEDQVISTLYSYSVTSNAQATAVTEGSPVTFTISRDGSGGASTIYWGTQAGTASVAAGDYQNMGIGRLDFAASETSKTVTVNTYTDALVEDDEYFYLNTYKTEADANNFNYDSYGWAYIQDPAVVTDYDYTVTSNADYTAPVTEGNTVTFTLTRSGIGSASTIYVSTSSGSADSDDYQSLVPLAISFGAFETSKTVSVTTYSDSLVEGGEYFWLDLYKTYADVVSGTWASYGTAYITDPTVTTDFSYTVASNARFIAVTEGSPVTFTITRSGSGSASTVYVSTSHGTTNAADFQELGLTLITFAANETSKTVTVNTNYDTITEGDELFWLDLYKSYSDASNGYWSSYGSAHIDDFGVSGAAPELFVGTPQRTETKQTVAALGVGATAVPDALSQSFPGHSLNEFNNDFAFAALRTDGSVVVWGHSANGGDLGSVSSALNGAIDVTHIYSNNAAFAALRTDGSVITWGNASAGGNSSAVNSALNGTLDVTDVFSTEAAFAALRADGSVVTWGDVANGGDSGAVAAKLNGSVDVSTIYSNMSAFAALRTDGSVVTWGFDLFGGDISAVATQLAGTVDVTKVVASGSAFAALRTDGSVVSWGSAGDGGNSSSVAAKLTGDVDVMAISASSSAFAARLADGSVVTWGDVNYGGNSNAVADKLNGSNDVTALASTLSAFAALRADGSVVTWGSADGGGNSAAVASALSGSVDVTNVFANNSAFAALRTDGSVVTWGNSAYGGDSSSVASMLNGSVDVTSVVANDQAFAALRADGSVVTWGSLLAGGDSTAVQSQLDGTVDVVQLYATSTAFAALHSDGSVVSWGNLDRGGDNSVSAGLTAVKTLSGNLLNDTPTTQDTLAPTVTSFSPADEATGIAVGSNIVLIFSEAIARGTGSIILKTSAGAVVATYDAATSPNLSIAGNTLTLNPSIDLASGTAYKVEFAAGSIQDLAGNAYTGNSSYNFSTAILAATDGNDTLTGTPGNDTLNGLGGTDTANYTQNLAAYSITVGNGVSNNTIIGPDGIDTFTNIERLHFADINLAFDIDTNAGQVYRLYQAAFNRTPDVAGLGGWIAAMDNGTPLLQIASSFMASAEFQSLYGTNPSNEAFVSNLYTNALHRPAQQDAGSAAGWVSQLAANQISRAQALVNFSESAENKASVLPAIASGITYATAEQAAGLARGQSYTGTPNADSFIGTVGRDSFTGGAGNDSIEGGQGLDKAIYSGNQSTHTITRTATGLTVSGGTDGSDTLSHVERLQFTDGVLALDIDGNAGQTYRLYQAALNRTPDKQGLSDWVYGMDNGLTLNQMASAFIASQEFTDRYGTNTSNAEFIDLLYANALHRAREVGDNYWTSQLDSGVTREQALIGFSESAENQVALMGVMGAGIALSV